MLAADSYDGWKMDGWMDGWMEGGVVIIQWMYLVRWESTGGKDNLVLDTDQSREREREADQRDSSLPTRVLFCMLAAVSCTKIDSCLHNNSDVSTFSLLYVQLL